MDITNAQDYAITLSLDKYNRERSSILFEGGTTTIEEGEERYIGSFIAKIYRKGKFRFDCQIEIWGNGQRVYSVDMRKIS